VLATSLIIAFGKADASSKFLLFAILAVMAISNLLFMSEGHKRGHSAPAGNSVFGYKEKLSFLLSLVLLISGFSIHFWILKSEFQIISVILIIISAKVFQIFLKAMTEKRLFKLPPDKQKQLYLIYNATVLSVVLYMLNFLHKGFLISSGVIFAFVVIALWRFLTFDVISK
ncbi:MAG: hypothetical protein HY606_00440, partial [Planctomycetes bacterium]|nr:hypothetical protein [Planctomycetota bacterium]